MSIVKFNELFSNINSSFPWLIPQRLQVTRGEMVVWMLGVGKRLLELG